MPLLFWLDVSALLVAAVVLAALALLVLGAGLAQALNRLFLILVVIQMFWITTSLWLRLSLWSGVGQPRLVAELLALALLLTGPTLLMFAAEYVGCRGSRISAAAATHVILVLAWLPPLLSHRLVTNPRVLSNGTTVADVSAWGAVAALAPVACFIWSLALYWQARRRTGETYLAWSVAALLAGFVFGNIINVPVPVTAVTQSVSVVLLGFGVVSRQLFNPLRERAAELTCEIAERVRTEEALRASEQRFRTIFDSVSDAIGVLEPATGRVLDVNRRTCEMFGWTREELCGTIAEQLSAGESPYTQAEALAIVSSSEEAQPFEWLARDRAGRQFWLEVSARRTMLDGAERLLVVARDITERREAAEQQRQLQARVFHSQKLESLGVLAGGIAHDFNNLLCGILGFAEIAQAEAPDGSRLAGRLQRIRDAASRAANLCRQLLAYAGRRRMSAEAVDLSGLVREMADLVRAAVTNKADLRLDLAGGLPLVEGDASQLTQVVLNLMVNASEALSEGRGVIVVSTGLKRCDGPALSGPYLHEDLPEGEYVFLRVSDTGVGMSEETKARLFDPFFTTKFAGRGLGLSAVVGIVRQHRGTIQVESQEGSGSTFTVLFPAATGAVAAKPVEPEASPSWQGSGTVLVVDDEPAARGAARAMLEEMGFDVLEAEDGLAGVEIFRAHAASITAVLLDLTMPRMGGEQALNAMRSICPGVRVVLMSGYGEADVTDRLGAQGPNRLLEKPFHWGQLAETLRQALA
jgi:PAS domain S-box-containing protein